MRHVFTHGMAALGGGVAAGLIITGRDLELIEKGLWLVGKTIGAAMRIKLPRSWTA